MATKKLARTIRVYRWGCPLDDTIVECKKIDTNIVKERVLQDFINKHLEELFGLTLIKSEFELDNTSRVDAIAFDNKKNCFVTLEYKKSDTDRIYRQLSSYNSYLRSNESKHAFRNKCSEWAPKNFVLPPFNKINWEKSYCIYLAYSISDDLINSLLPIRKGTDIRMYEVHVFDGNVVLYRADADDASVYDTYTKSTKSTPEPNDGAVPNHNYESPLLDLKNDIAQTHMPVKITFPDSTTAEAATWSLVLKAVADYLYKEKKIYDAKQNRLLRTEISYRPGGQPYSHYKLSDNLYVFAHLSSVEKLRSIKLLLTDVNFKPGQFKIILKPR